MSISARPALRRHTLVIGAIVFVLVLVSTLLGVFEFPELRAYDIAFILRGPRPDAAPIVIAAIDDESFAQTQQRWPWPRTYFAQLIERIATGKPRVVALDVLFYESAEGDDTLAAAIQRAGNVVLANNITIINDPNYALEQRNEPVPILSQAASAIGFSNIARDADGFVRRVLIYQPLQGQTQYHWVAQTAARYLGITLPNQAESNHLDFGTLNVPLITQSLLINFHGPPRTIKTIPAYQVTNGDIAPDFFRDKVVLVGATTETLHDTYPTSFQGDTTPMAGVEIGAQALDTLLGAQFIWRWSPGIMLLLMIGAGGIGLALNHLARPFVALVVLALLMGSYALVWYGAFALARTQIPFVPIQAALFLTFIVPAAERAVEEEAAKRRLRHIFSQFIAPEMIDQLVARGVEGTLGQRAELTILFADIRGFTTLSEKLAPEQVAQILNEHLTAMTEVIFRNHGTIDKFEGDAILAFWGAPTPNTQHARDAVRAALEMKRALEQLRAGWQTHAAPQDFEMGFGLNTGEVFVGLIGSARRVNYTVIGDHVNLAARLQELTKEDGWPILISQATFDLTQDEFETEYIGTRLVKGKTVPVAVYRVLGYKSAPQPATQHPRAEMALAQSISTVEVSV